MKNASPREAHPIKHKRVLLCVFLAVLALDLRRLRRVCWLYCWFFGVWLGHKACVPNRAQYPLTGPGSRIAITLS